mgnify:CR=1 FL=1
MAGRSACTSRGSRPAAFDHEIAEKAEREQNQQISQMIVGGIGPNESEEQDERDKHCAADQSELGQVIQKKKD